MANIIEKAAKSFLKEVKGKIDFSTVEAYLLEKGFRVIFYNTDIGDKELSRFHLNHKASKTKAFTYSGVANIVFIDDDTSPEDKTYLLYHELGHILLSHLKNDRMNTQNKILMDIEADAFAYQLLHPNKTNPLIVSISVLAVVLCIFATAMYSLINNHSSNNVTATSVESSIDIPVSDVAVVADETSNFDVVISSTGKYHRESCIHVQNKNYLKIDKLEAEKIYQPCKVCNP